MRSVEAVESGGSIAPRGERAAAEPLEEAILPLALRPEPHSIRQARSFVSEFLAHAVDADVLEDAVLLTSELVTNAVLHGGPHSPKAAIRVSVEHLAGRLRIGVEDAGQNLPVLSDRAPTNVGGRGLLLVESLADQWGCEPVAGGKVVWFEVVTSPVATSNGGDLDG